MKEFIKYIEGNPEKLFWFFMILIITGIISVAAITQGVWWFGVPLFVIVNGVNLFGDWMNYKGYWV